MDIEKPKFGIGRLLLQFAWFGTFLCEAIMVILWLSSFMSGDSSLFFKMNLVTGILIFLINFFALRRAWEVVNGTNGINVLYLFTGALMIVNVFCIPVAVIYVGVPVYMRIKEKQELQN